MASSELINYIGQRQRDGISTEQIVSELISAGWKFDEIQQTLSSIATVPHPPAAIPIPKPPAPATMADHASPPPSAQLTQTSATPSAPEHASSWNWWEELFSVRGLVYIGLLALLIGGGLFLKFAFDNNWVPPVARVGLGVIGSAALMALGTNLSHRYKNYGQALIGGGSALLYLTFYAAYGFYHLIGLEVAYILLTICVAITLGLSALHRAIAVAIIGAVGAYLSPLLLSGGDLLYFPLFYGLAVLWGLHFVMLRYGWKELIVVTITGSLLLIANWLDRYTTALFWPTMVTVALYAISMIATAVAYKSFQPNDDKQADGAMAVSIAISTLLYYALSYAMIEEVFPAAKGAWTFLLAILFAVMALLLHSSATVPAIVTSITRHLALFFVTIAIPVQFDQHWVTVSWAIVGAYILSIGLMQQMTGVRMWGLGLLAMSVFRLLLIDIIGFETRQFFFNELTLVVVLTVAATSVSAWLYKKVPGPRLGIEEDASAALEVASHCTFLWFLLRQADDYFALRSSDVYGLSPNRSLYSARDYLQSLLYILYGIVLVVPGIAFKKRNLRILASAFFVVAIFKVFLYDAFSLSQGYRIASFLSLGVILLLAAFFYNKYRAQVLGFLEGGKDTHR